MTLRIEPEGSVNHIGSFHKVDQGQEAAKRKAQDQQDAQSAEQIDLSPRAQDIAKVQQVLAATPDVRSSRVEELKAAIEAGTYRVSSQDVAESVLRQNILERIV